MRSLPFRLGCLLKQAEIPFMRSAVGPLAGQLESPGAYRDESGIAAGSALLPIGAGIGALGGGLYGALQTNPDAQAHRIRNILGKSLLGAGIGAGVGGVGGYAAGRHLAQNDIDTASVKWDALPPAIQKIAPLLLQQQGRD